MKNILIIDDDLDIGNVLEEILKNEGYSVSRAYSGTEAVFVLSQSRPDLILLDLMLPGLSGEEVLPHIKGIPVIVMSAKADIDNKVELLLGGAVDYVTKPFYMGELLARIRAALRRKESRVSDKNTIFEDGDLVVDYEQRRVEAGGREVHLTPIEYKILLLLIANRGKVLTHHYILKEIWGYAEGVEAATLRVFMATLRRKIEQNPSQPQHIITEVGVGYRFK